MSKSSKKDELTSARGLLRSQDASRNFSSDEEDFLSELTEMEPILQTISRDRVVPALGHSSFFRR